MINDTYNWLTFATYSELQQRIRVINMLNETLAKRTAHAIVSRLTSK